MFTVTSDGIQNGQIERKFGKHSRNLYKGFPALSLPLEWGNAPEGTRSYAVIFQDYDAYPVSGFSVVHWMVADMPHSVNHLRENASRDDFSLIQGSNSLISKFLDDYDPDLTNYYLGPGPKTGIHEYEVCMYALDEVLGLKPGFFLNELVRGMRGHILAEAKLYGLYSAT